MFENPAGIDLSMQFNVIENVFEGLENFQAELILTNNSPKTLQNNWSVYFNFLRRILPETVSKGFQIKHINGDFFSLEPTNDFRQIPPNTSVTISFVAAFWAIKTIDMPVGFYIIYRDFEKNELKPEAITNICAGPFVQKKQLIRNAADRMEVPTAQSRYDQNSGLQTLWKHHLMPILPTPVLCQTCNGYFQLNTAHSISFEPGLKSEAMLLSNSLSKLLGYSLSIAEGNSGDIIIKTESVVSNNFFKKHKSGAYHLLINSDGIKITGNDKAGVFYAIQSLRMLIDQPELTEKSPLLRLPFVEIQDSPQFDYRGMHLDVGRNFQKSGAIKKILDLMAMYKLNKFHFHLTDDEGWRIEIPGLPELTEIGGRRGHTFTETACLLPSYGSGPDPNDPLSTGNGFYSCEEFMDLLQYAQNLHIEVIPAIDFPGHARAAVRAMEVRYERFASLGDYEKANEYLLTDWEDASVYESVQMWRRNVVNIGMESTYRFIGKVVEELHKMYLNAGLNLEVIHIGGDEVPHGVWTKSPACQKLIESNPGLVSAQDLADYFLIRVNRILESKSIMTAGWEEIALLHNNGMRKPNNALTGHHIRPYVWNTIWGGGGEEVAYDLANTGFDVVLSNATNLYFDFAYDKDPEEEGYYWGGYINTENTFRFLPYDLYQSAEQDILGNPIDADVLYKNAIQLTEKGKKHIIGIQGQLWGETIRSPERIEYLLFPRMLALAERAWVKEPDWAKLKDTDVRKSTYQNDWNKFANRIGQIELPRLDALYEGVGYRIPLPGAKVEKGTLFANIEFPGLEIRYTTDGAEPTINSTLYEKPIPIPIDTEIIKLKTFTTNGRSSRTCVINH